MTNKKRTGWTLAACVLMLGMVLAGCGMTGKLEKLGYSEAEINSIKDTDYADGIVKNKIQYEDLNDIRKHSAFKAENLGGYTSVFNKLYTKEQLDLVIIGINALKDMTRATTRSLMRAVIS